MRLPGTRLPALCGSAAAPGHALIIPTRHVASWFDATPEEQREILGAIPRLRQQIECEHRPDGYNIGVNVGEAAGQTVHHLHVHVIPRYSGDVPDPRGGVRHVIPSRGNYLTPLPPLPDSRTRSALVAGGADDPLLPHLLSHLDRATGVDIAVAFALESGVALLEEHLRDVLDRGGRVRLLTGDYLGVTEPAALLRLLDLQGKVELRIFQSAGTSFHPKAYILFAGEGEGAAFPTSHVTAPSLW